MATDARDRFWKFVHHEPNTGCWLWGGALDSRKYGHIGGPNQTILKAHAISYEIHHGKPPAGMLILHKCDVTWCVNPAHLYAGTAKQNSEDAVRRCRTKKHTTKNCPQGHPYSGDNLYITYNCARRCRICVAVQRERHRARRAAGLASKMAPRHPRTGR